MNLSRVKVFILCALYLSKMCPLMCVCGGTLTSFRLMLVVVAAAVIEDNMYTK